MYNKYFCTFADSRMKKSLNRVERQIKESNYFDTILINNENDLDKKFVEVFRDKLIKGSRGFGYWVWKPQVILQALKKMKKDDILLYMDVGCHFNKNGLKRMDYYVDMAIKSSTGILAFNQEKLVDDISLEMFDSSLEKYYTKGDLFDYFKVRNEKSFYNTGQIGATAILIRKCDQSEQIIESWLNVFKENFSLANNNLSISPNFEGFREHRHDQSIFSILCKLKDVSTLSYYEIWQMDWNKLANYPILAKRDKDLNLYWHLHRKIASIFSSIKK